MKTEIKKENGIYFLYREDHRLQCPFRAPVPIMVQASIGPPKPELLPTPCSSLCPFFDIMEVDKIFDLKIHCAPDFKI